ADQQVANNYKIRVQGVIPGDPMDESNNFFSIVAELPVPKIVINEIMYNPSNSNPVLPDNRYEYLELYNNSTFTVDLTGWKVTNAISHTFTSGTILTPGEYLVLAKNADSLMNYYGISNVITWDVGDLNNTGETIELRASDQTLMDVVSYSSSSPWPSAANGQGPSLELIHPDLDNSLVENWMASIAELGTPGAQNSVYGYEKVTVIAPNGGETFYTGTSTNIQWSRVNYSGNLKIELLDGESVVQLLANNIPAVNESWSWAIADNQSVGTTFKIRISDVEDGEPMDESDGFFAIATASNPTIKVLSPNGGEVITQGVIYDITWSTVDYQGTVLIELLTSTKNSDAIELGTAESTAGTFAWNVTQDPGNNYIIAISDLATGAPSDQSDAPFTIQLPPQDPKIVINEIMYNPPEAGNDTLEYIE
ncbi:MAG TPA: lamin tail domain-containing protein, partial [Candidatus Marinimicrobia bacterium]|nr:lamin tail domain-containing protein [Candidatus Neomarinimicrobiota bacterium]